MLNLLTDPYTWALVAMSTVFGVVIGRLQHRSLWAIALNIISANAFIHGMRLAAGIGGEAFLAAAMTSGAVMIWSELDRRHRTRRLPDVAQGSA